MNNCLYGTSNGETIIEIRDRSRTITLRQPSLLLPGYRDTLIDHRSGTISISETYGPATVPNTVPGRHRHPVVAFLRDAHVAIGWAAVLIDVVLWLVSWLGRGCQSLS